HHGIPTLHFDKLSCTACHSGPIPSDATMLVQTSMSHQLGLPRRVTADGAAPVIQQPIFLRDLKTGKIGPYRVLVPAYWAWMSGQNITPLLPQQVIAAGADPILGEAPDPKQFAPLEKL